MSTFIKAHFDGNNIVPDEPVDLPKDQPLEVELRVLPVGGAPEVGRLAVTAMPFFGMWADRDDMADSSEWVRKEREKWGHRLTGQD